MLSLFLKPRLCCHTFSTGSFVIVSMMALDLLSVSHGQASPVGEALAYPETTYALSHELEMDAHLIEVLRAAGQTQKVARFIEERRL